MDSLSREALHYSGFGNAGASPSEWRQGTASDAFPDPDGEVFSDARLTHRMERCVQLARSIETEIIPRLMRAHRILPGQAMRIVPGVRRDFEEEIVEFCGLVLAHELRDAVAFLDDHIASGVALESIYLDLLAPAARHLGALWESDELGFAEVTLGLGRLQQVMHEFGPAFRGEGELCSNGRRALLVPVPGEQHRLGLFMVSEFFRRAGWEVWSEPATTETALADVVRSEWFDLVGLSAGSDCRLEVIAATISALRMVSCNRSMAVLVGGPVFLAHPDYVALVGADATASDASDAVVKGEAIVASQERR